MTNTVFGSQDPSTTANSYNTDVFVIEQILAQMQTVSLVKIVACSADGAVAAPGTVNMQVLANLMTGNRTPVPHGILANRPYFRLRGGSNAVIMDPAPGDIGIAVFCSRDSSAVIQAQGAANPGSFRTFDWADGIYIGGLLGETPLQYLQFNSSGVTLVSPTALTLQAPTVSINGATTVEGTQTVTGAAVFDTTVGVTGEFTAASADVTGDMSVGGSLTVSGGIIGSVAVDSADSVTGTGLPAAPLKLVGDSASPGNTYYYGTNALGTKGFYALTESTGTVTSVGITSAGTIAVTGTNPVTSSGDINVDIAPTGVTAGIYSYPTLNVNAEGQITAIISNTPSSGTVTSVGIASSTLTLSGTNPVTSSGDIDVNLTSGIVTPGSFTNANITVDTYGRVTAAANGSDSGTIVDILSDQRATGTPGTNKLEYFLAAAGATVTLVNYQGGNPGYVDQIMYALSSLDIASFTSATVNVYIDGSATASISLPAPFFFQGQYQFGNGSSSPFAVSYYNNRFFGGNSGQSGSTQLGTYYCMLPIPFTTGVKITITNGSSSDVMTVYSHVKYQTGVPNTWPGTRKLFMKYTNIASGTVNAHEQLLNITGTGRFVGLWFMEDDSPHSLSPLMAALEGDFRLYVDKVTNIWAASSTYAVGNTIIDSNGNLQTVSAITTGTSGSTQPTWSQVAGATTSDSGVTWTETPGTPNQVWRASVGYVLNMMLIDTNGNVQRVTTAGTSGSSQPSWNATVGGTTTDNGVTWTNQGSTYMQASWQTDGTESYFMLGFYFANVPGFWSSNGYIGTTFFNRGGSPAVSTTTPTTISAYRYHTVDPIRFSESLSLMWQCGDSSEVAWSSGNPELWVVVYYYTD